MIRTALQRGEQIRRELVNYTKGGGKFWAEIDIAPVCDSSGLRKYFVAVQRDITARKDGEAVVQARELRHLKQRNALISLAATGPSATGDVLADVQQITRVAARTLEVARVSIWHCSPEYVICHEHVGESRVWTLDEKTFVSAIASHVSLVLEANERTRAEKELVESHQRFQFVASATNDTIWDWDLADNSFWWNDGFARLFGWVADQGRATVHTWIRQIHPEDRDRVARGIFAAVAGDTSNWCDEYRFYRNDGRVAHVLDRGQIIRDSAGRGIRMVGGMTDLTEKKEAELELARSHRALQMLSSCNELLICETDEAALLNQVCRLATEIGGYRMAWIGYAMEDPECRLVQIAQAGGRAGDYAEIETSWADKHPAGKGPVADSIRSGKPIFCNDVTEDPAFAGWVRSAGEREYEGVVCLPLSNDCRTFGALVVFAAKAHSAGADELQLLRQMANDLAFGIVNLRSRAERQRTQEIVLKVARAVSSAVGVEFFDLLARNMVEALGADGGGISPDIRDKIFDPFFSTKPIGKGTGLGLSTSLAIIKGHGGFILTDSEPGRGTCFRVFLPAQPDAAKRLPARQLVELFSGNGQSILMVDDEDPIRKVTQETLEAFGYRSSHTT